MSVVTPDNDQTRDLRDSEKCRFQTLVRPLTAGI